jgi:hypothetical protein
MASILISSWSQYYGDESFYHAVVVASSRRGWFIAFSGFEEDGLQDTKVSDILRASPRLLGTACIWVPCEACFYADGTYYPAHRGPVSSSGGNLVAFVGFEQEPLQDTDPADIRMTQSGRAGRTQPGSGGRRDRTGADTYGPAGNGAQQYSDERLGPARSRTGSLRTGAGEGGAGPSTPRAGSLRQDSDSGPGTPRSGRPSINSRLGPLNKVPLDVGGGRSPGTPRTPPTRGTPGGWGDGDTAARRRESGGRGSGDVDWRGTRGGGGGGWGGGRGAVASLAAQAPDRAVILRGLHPSVSQLSLQAGVRTEGVGMWRGLCAAACIACCSM